ncbi:hypothetical protein B0H14DRAFT_2923502 [Mycena olivaceomarginata]|nr:hypothetical protein B0H14DRAFT_2923502 [Mycena olivaceomarginata]
MFARRVGQRAAVLPACRYTSSQASAKEAGQSYVPYVVGDRALKLRTMQHITSPLDAIAMVRAVERRFGRVAVYQFNRDAEIPSRYQFVAYLSFWDPESYSRVPPNALVSVKLPPENPSIISGGPGLADITPYLDSKDLDPTAEAVAESEQPATLADGSRIVQFRLETYTARIRPGRLHLSLMSNFVRWGGFAPKESLPEPPTITRSHMLFGGATVDNPRMRHQLMQWSVVRNPFESRRPLVRSPARDSAPTPAPEPKEEQPRIRQAQGDFKSSESATDLSWISEAAPSDSESATDLPWISKAAPSDAAIPPQQNSASEPTSSPQPPSSQSPTGEAHPAEHVSAPASSPEPTRPQPVVQVEAAPATSSSAPSPSPSPSPSKPQPQPSAKPQASAKSKSAKAGSSKPVVQTQQAPTPVAAPVARRNDARAARGVVQKVKPTEPVASAKVAVQAPQTKKQQQPIAPAEKKKAKPNPAAKQTGKSSGQPIEVEERTSGMSDRLKGMLRGWL